MKLHRFTLTAIVAVLISAAGAQATEVIFDEAPGSGFTLKWNTKIYSDDPAYEGDNYVAGADYGKQIVFEHSGYTVGDAAVLDMYVNTHTATPVNLMLRLVYTDIDGVVHSCPFDDRGNVVTWLVDDVEYTGVEGIPIDGDTSTWQHVELDLMQPTYLGWPWVEHQLVTGDSITQMLWFTDPEASGFIFDNVVLNPSAALMGDANADGQVDGNDLISVEENFGATGDAIPGDANNDGQVDGNDLISVEENFGATADASSVPEPATLGLLALGGLAMLRRRP